MWLESRLSSSNQPALLPSILLLLLHYILSRFAFPGPSGNPRSRLESRVEPPRVVQHDAIHGRVSGLDHRCRLRRWIHPSHVPPCRNGDANRLSGRYVVLWIQRRRLGVQCAIAFHLLFPHQHVLVDISADTLDGDRASAVAWNLWAAHVHGGEGMEDVDIV